MMDSEGWEVDPDILQQIDDTNSQLWAHSSPGVSPKDTQEDGGNTLQAAGVNSQYFFSHLSLGGPPTGAQEGDDYNPQAADVNPQYVFPHPSPGGSPNDTQEGDEDTPQVSDANLQYVVTHPHPGSPVKDTGVVVGPQRKKGKERAPKDRYPCGFLGEQCPFMPSKDGFETCAKLKEDAQRHINGYQCLTCGKRFGKPYSLTRHGENKTGCIKCEFNPVHPRLQSLLGEIEKAKGYKDITFICKQCMLYCDMKSVQPKARRNKYKYNETRAPRQQTRNTRPRGKMHLTTTQYQAPQVPSAPEMSHTSRNDTESSGELPMNNDMTGGFLALQGRLDGGDFALPQQRGEQELASIILGQANSRVDMGYGGYSEARSTYSGEVAGTDEYSGLLFNNHNTPLSYEDFNRRQSYSLALEIISPQALSLPVAYLPTYTSESATACSATTTTDIAHNLQQLNLEYDMSINPFVNCHADGLTTDYNQPLTQQACGDQQPGYASETPAVQVGTADLTFDQNLQLAQEYWPSRSYYGMRNPTTLGGNQLQSAQSIVGWHDGTIGTTPDGNGEPGSEVLECRGMELLQ